MKRRRPQWYRTLLADVKERGLGCFYCGAPADSLDHVHELQEGGPNIRQNLVPACMHCNARKGRATQAARRRTNRGGTTRSWIRKP